MKIAVYNIYGIQTTRDDKILYYSAVTNNYDFIGNNATDVTTIDNLLLFNKINRLDVIQYRDSLNSIYTATTFSSLTITQKEILSQNLIPTKTERETIYTTSVIGDYATILQNKYNTLASINNSNDNGDLYATNLSSYVQIIDQIKRISISGTTISGGTYYGDGSNLTNLPNSTYITGATFNNNTLTLRNNTGGTITVTGFTDNYTTGTTLINNIVYFNRNDQLSAYTINLNSLITNDVYVTGGTYSNLTGIETLRNNTGGTFNVTGFFKTSDDIYTTGLTFNNSTYDLKVNKNDGTIYTVNLGVLSSDMTITGGTYNNITGIATFTNNSGGTFNVTGFITGLTDTYVTAFTYSNNVLTISQTASQSNINLLINSMTGLTINGVLSATTISGNTFYGNGSNLTGIPNTFTTGATLINNIVYFNRNDSLSAYSVNLSIYTADTNTFITGSSFSNNNLLLIRNDGTIINQLLNNFSGLTINGSLISNIISATTISATTYYGNGSNLNNVVHSGFTIYSANTQIAISPTITNDTLIFSGINIDILTNPINKIITFSASSTGGGISSFTGITSVDFGFQDGFEDSFTTTAVTNSNILSTSSIIYRVIPSTNHNEIEDSLLEGLVFNESDIINGVGFTLNVTALNNTWGVYNIFYKIVN